MCSIAYIKMISVHETDAFADWLDKLHDARAKARIIRRIDRLANGYPGDVKPVGQGVSELRIDYGPGYRVYFIQRGALLIVLLCGGDKRRQEADINRAKKMARAWKE